MEPLSTTKEKGWVRKIKSRRPTSQPSQVTSNGKVTANVTWCGYLKGSEEGYLSFRDRGEPPPGREALLTLIDRD